MIRPPAPFWSTGKIAFEIWAAPVTSVRMKCWISSGSTSINGASTQVPTEFTRVSSCPNTCKPLSTTLVQSAQTLTSPGTGWTHAAPSPFSSFAKETSRTPLGEVPHTVYRIKQRKRIDSLDLGVISALTANYLTTPTIKSRTCF